MITNGRHDQNGWTLGNGSMVNTDKTDSHCAQERTIMKCEDIQPLLFDYMSRELTGAREVIIREHLRKCKNCQAAARDIQATLDLLRKASSVEKQQVTHLSESRRKKIVRAFTHPIMSWVERHILLVSIIGAIIVIISVTTFMRFMMEKHFAMPEGEVITVMIVSHGQTNVIAGTNEAQKENSSR
jgi:predicted anti-sigma-YlaC factor YlaD